MNRLVVPAVSDLHLHVRQSAFLRALTAALPAAGYSTALVMPNTLPPITTVSAALDYTSQIKSSFASGASALIKSASAQGIEIKHSSGAASAESLPELDVISTLYLNDAITPEVVRAAAAAGVRAIKSYPRGVTTHSDSGISPTNLNEYYPVFQAMSDTGLVLCLHGELPSNPSTNTCVLNAEDHFLPILHRLHAEFPKLRIVLEHATTRAAVEAVKACGDTVACTITAHHLMITVDDWAGGLVHSYCKPVAKYPADRDALRSVVRDGHPRFFLGTDSAPHPKGNKEKIGTACAGVYTAPIVLPLMAQLFDEMGCLEKLAGFISTNGRKFYGLADETRTVELEKSGMTVPASYEYVTSDDGKETTQVVPFMAGKKLDWAIKSISF
ncbi:Dihydroorotase homodimeric type [Ramicandelaber brevisporus]|nr:Dihydroorotase homodimeric type [Ramicandelaber brevisporus]KAI8868568.1 Dihydroorotase homodimeric type [Ramicandelaber brevisporus]